MGINDLETFPSTLEVSGGLGSFPRQREAPLWKMGESDMWSLCLNAELSPPCPERL